MFELDFSLLPEIQRGKLMMGLPSDIEEDLGLLGLSETLDRLKGACRFIDEVSAHKDDWLNRAFFRAGLSEFRSVAQALHWDIGRQQVYSPEKSKNPLIHLIFRLRRITVYASNLSTKKKETSFSVFFDGKDHKANVNVLMIQNLEQTLSKEKLDEYKPEDIQTICSWFEKNQSVFGASHVLSIGVLLYCLELCEVYKTV
ncbi:MAG: hypothetical protein RIE52_10860 [Balneola sp.]|jgi:hypothetical protein